MAYSDFTLKEVANRFQWHTEATSDVFFEVPEGAAQLFNEHAGHPISTLFGVATTGSLWQFLKLHGKTLTIDRREYHIDCIAKIVGILVWMIRTAEDILVQSEVVDTLGVQGSQFFLSSPPAPLPSPACGHSSGRVA